MQKVDLCSKNIYVDMLTTLWDNVPDLSAAPKWTAGFRCSDDPSPGLLTITTNEGNTDPVR